MYWKYLEKWSILNINYSQSMNKIKFMYAFLYMYNVFYIHLSYVCHDDDVCVLWKNIFTTRLFFKFHRFYFEFNQMHHLFPCILFLQSECKLKWLTNGPHISLSPKIRSESEGNPLVNFPLYNVALFVVLMLGKIRITLYIYKNSLISILRLGWYLIEEMI